MDLRSIINTTEAADSSAQKQVTPITPVQAAPPQQAFRDYSHPQLGPPSTHPSQDYSPRGSDPYASPTAYQPGYQGRPSAPPPLQPPSQNDLRSPAGSYSAQSPYPRHTPSSSTSGGQYPFPQNQTPQSPAQPHPYGNPIQHRDSYPPSHQLQAHNQHQNSYSQQSPMTSTPTIGTPGSAQAYFHQQRSQSSNSISTPTSAHSQQQYFSQYPQESPVSTGPSHPTQIPQHQRQRSQPHTPHAPLVSNQRQLSGNFAQPTSPYQQRPPSSGAIHQPYASSHGSTPPSLQRQNTQPPTTPTVYNPHQGQVPDSLPRSQSVRERSLSVSPKTQLTNLPQTEMAVNQQQPVENGHSAPLKRKLNDREASEATRAPQVTNGDQTSHLTLTPSPQQPSRKRIRYTEPPIWARSVTGRIKNNAALMSLHRSVNGRQSERMIKAEPLNGNHPIATVTPARPPAQIAQIDFRGEGPLGPWEPSINGIPPYEEVSKIVADWLFLKVVTRSDARELASRGVEIEIEAKLGQLINKDTNERFWLPVQSECILADNGRVSFRSSMTEAQHKALNEFLNGKVEETHPDNPNRTKPRVQIVYAHRRERDKFYELPASVHTTLPACIRSELNPRHMVKVRVTHDQKTGQLLAKIIKARVADLDLYNPRFPLDCRISVNLEMKYEGDIEALLQSADGGRIADRNKDRLSYTQSHYQIDLTQVTVADPNSKTGKEHELEIEVSAAAVLEQGRRALAGEPHQYAELIEGLMDNVRVLTRNVPDESVVIG